MTITIHRWATPTDLAAWRVEEQPDGLHTLCSPTLPLPSDSTEIIPSWGADTPPGTAVEIQLRVRYGERWTNRYRMAVWDSAPANSRRTSFDTQRDDDGYVCTDTLVVRPGANAVEALVVLHRAGDLVPQLRGLTLTCSGTTEDATPSSAACAPCCIETPCFSQFSYAEQDGWCSPTSLGMVLGFWHERSGRPELAPFVDPSAVPQFVAPGVYDPIYGGYGNWSFNVAFAAALGLESFVARMNSLAEVDPWLAAGVPVVMSVAWNEGQLAGAPIPRSRGHLIVATGVTTRGDILVADPAGATPAEVRRSYRREQLERCWLRPHGTVYLIYPAHWPVPILSGMLAETFA